MPLIAPLAVPLVLLLHSVAAGAALVDEPRAGGPLPAEREAAIAIAAGHLESEAPELAVEILIVLAERHPGDPQVDRLLGVALLAAGRPAEALRPLALAARSPAEAVAASYAAARASARLGRPTDAVRWLDRAWEAGFRDLDRVRAEPDLAGLSDDERFERWVLGAESSLVPFPDSIRVIHEFRGREAGETYGWTGIDAGDVDGDGRRDVAISAPFARREGAIVGRVEVRSGRTGELLLELRGETDERFGTALGAAGDLDRDGHADLVVGAPGAEDLADAGPGRIAVFSGRDGALLVEKSGALSGDRFGAEARGTGDWDGDGVPDILVGSPGADGKGGADAGRVEILSGRDLSTLRVLEGEREGDRFGSAAWGEARREGHFLVVGAGRAGERRLGRAYLYRGAEPELIARVDAGEDGGSLGESHVSIVGDVDADGLPDFAVADWRSGARGRHSGRVVIHSGADGARIRDFTGGHGEGLGSGDGVAGDANGDGHADIIIGAWLSSRGASDGGAAFLYSGKDSQLLETWVGRTVGDHVGFDATGIGDVDGDGAGDYLITAASSRVSGKDTGRAFIVAGPKYFRRKGGGDRENE